MPDLIDSLLVTLDLDPSSYIQKQKEVDQFADKAQKDHEKRSKEMVSAQKSVGEEFASVTRNALLFFGALTGSNAIKNMVADFTRVNAALGRLAQSVNTTPEVISAISEAVERSGGTAQEAAAAFRGFSDHIQELKTNSESSLLPILYKLQSVSGKTINLNKSVAETFGDIADAVGSAAQKDPAWANYAARQLTGSDALASIMMKGGAAWQASLAESQRHGLVTKEDVTQAQALQSAWTGLNQSVTSYQRMLVTDISPATTKMLTAWSDWLDSHRDQIQTELVEPTSRLASGFGAVTHALTGQDGATAAMELFGAAIFTKVLYPLGLLIRGLGVLNPLLGGLAIVSALFSGDPSKAIIAGGVPDRANETNDLGLPGLDHENDPSAPRRHGGLDHSRRAPAAPAAPTDQRNWWQRHAPKILGGRDAPKQPVLAPYTPGDSHLPRGLRNNNPGNIEAGSFAASQEGYAGSDGRFARFSTTEQGIRAAGNLLDRYQAKGTNTVYGMISKWAPPSENDTAAYANGVAKQIGVGINDPVDVKDPAVRAAIIRAMSRIENGREAFTQDQVLSALSGKSMNMPSTSPPAPPPAPPAPPPAPPAPPPAPPAPAASASSNAPIDAVKSEPPSPQHEQIHEVLRQILRHPARSAPIGTFFSPTPLATSPVSLLPPHAAAMHIIGNPDRWQKVSNNSTSTSDVKIGTVNVHTQADNAREIAASIGPALKRDGLVAHPNTGLA